jgi:hypothetical protein
LVRGSARCRLRLPARDRGPNEHPGCREQLHVRVAAHEHVVSKAEAAVAQLNEPLAKANNDGSLRAFNRQYRTRREAARSRGQGYMTYAAARNRLLRALAEHAAGTTPSAAVFGKVFER